ncbi:MAG: hypothetical protein WC028_25665 [Candidatus Obscuribacterales bacterium]|jgi:hypothetical protein
MFDIRMVFLLALCAYVVVGAVIFFVSLHRSRMAPLVREAMNTAYQVVEFHKINLIPERCDGETLLRFAAACAMFRDAENSLCAGRYKRTVELAKQATATIRSLHGRLVCQEHPRPVGPSCRIISNGGLLWMGN